MKKLLLLFVLSFSVIQLLAQLSWQSRPSFPGPSRHHAIGFSHGSKGYVMTGEDTAQFGDVWEYDTITNAWVQLPDYPGPARSYGIGAVVNDTAYIGFGYADTTFLTDWWAYDFSTSTWSQKSPFPGQGRNHPTATTLDGKIYMGFGDNYMGSINDWWEYDPATDAWTQKTNYPGLKMHHPVSAADNNYIYLSEGHVIDTTSNYGSIGLYSYKASNDTWTTLADMPGPGVVAGASFYLGNNKLYSGAGITEPLETFHNEFYEFDITSGTWDTIADYAGTGVFGPVSFNIGPVGYVATGFGNFGTTQDFFALAPIPPLDAGISSIATINNGPSCNSTFIPELTLKNFGSSILTSCTINYMIDANTVQTYSWTGTLASLATTLISLPGQTVTPGTHLFTSYVSDPNGSTDPNAWNDQLTQEFLVFSATTVSSVVTEGFDSTSFPPLNWQRYNPDGGATWERIPTIGGFGNSTSSIWVDCYNYSADGAEEFMYTPPMDFSFFLLPSYMTFSVAYAPFDSIYCEALDLDVSTDCGLHWTNVYSKSCFDLATDSATQDPFVADSSQWRSDTVNLDSYVGNLSVMVRFKLTNHFGNNIFLDDINFHPGILGTNELEKGIAIKLYPNPANNLLTFSETLNDLEVFNVLGDLVISKNEKSKSISTSNLVDGIYFLKSDKGMAKFIVKH